MKKLLSSICNFHDSVFRNTVGIHLGFNEFDDLADDQDSKEFANKSSQSLAERFTEGEIKFHAIDYVFNLKTWLKTRFGDGTFPVWYSSKKIETTFHETIFHWINRYILKPQDFLKEEEPISTIRTVFNVKCNAALVDFREQATTHFELIDPNIESYSQTQTYGIRLSSEGHPGIISRSARDKQGENIVVFNKRILSSPDPVGDYLYQFDPQSQKTLVQEFNSGRMIFEI